MTRQRFSMPAGMAGHQALAHLVREYGGAAVVAKDFRVTPQLLGRWLSGDLEAPFTFFLALWWQGPMGFRQAYSESHWTHDFVCFLRREAVDRVELLERLIVQAGYALPPGAITSRAEAVTIPEDWQPWKTSVSLPPPDRLVPALVEHARPVGSEGAALRVGLSRG